ncbi:hypothetical protein ANCCEY_02216 [Ancylostoma ceylanicum]|uniref:SCP domain-containing protein n=1 Tax=Ancylostoma ceylanicum TaxID=53326 RepID=A0A0D6MCD0_9BILA|nr:hypothetical protein ANCCEY_02216 [Ancylostoma ceylanicum]
MWGTLLKWDCNLEEMAYEGTLGTCTLPSGNLPFDPYQSMQAGWPPTALQDLGAHMLFAMINRKGFSSAFTTISTFTSALSVQWSLMFNSRTPNPANRIIYEAAADEALLLPPFRKLLASGWAKDKKSKSGFALPGKKMLALTYDCAPGTDNGANKTYALIEKCPKTDPSPTPGYSLNFLRLKNYTVSEQDALKHAIKTWWGELEKTGLGSNTTFKENSGITSFANMAHDETDKFACAVQNCKQNGETLVACQYSQKVDEGDPIYVTGKVCSGCKNLNKKCSNPQGLCE